MTGPAAGPNSPTERHDMLLNAINFGQIGDTWLFAIKESDALLLMFATLVLGAAAVWLARREQPTPHAERWGRAEAVRRHPSGKHKARA